MDNKMKITKIIILIPVVLLTACSTFGRMFPDNSGEYRRAETMPDLEVPPDLTAGAINDRMAIPGEQARTDMATGIQAASRLAVIQTINNNKNLLSIPEEFTVAWAEIDKTLQNSGLIINERNQTRGIFNVTYSPGSGQERGWLSGLAFWSDDRANYLISLTGVGNKTELVVLSPDGEWESTAEADGLLSTLMTQYNLSRTQ
jgi:uncharacterized lipoprotein